MPEDAPGNKNAHRRVFVSYSSSDRTRVTGLGLLLEALGHQVFLDHRTIKPGARWQAELQEGLLEADVLVVFWTKRAAQAGWVRKEYEYFHIHFPDRLLVPVLGDETPLSELLKAHQHSDFAPLINELLELKRQMARDGVDAKGIQQAILKRLAQAGIEFDEPERNKLFGFVGAGAIAGLGAVTAAIGFLRSAGRTATEAAAQLSGAQVVLVAAGVISGGVVCGVTDELVSHKPAAEVASLSTTNTAEQPGFQLDGRWQGGDWGEVSFVGLEGHYTSTYGAEPGKIRVAKRDNGAYSGIWREGDPRHGTLEMRFESKDVIAGTWTLDPSSRIEGPAGGPLRWTRIKPSDTSQPKRARGDVTNLKLATLAISNLQARTVAVCSPESRCFNTASAGWAGVVTPETQILELPAGTYKLRFDAHYLDGVEVTAGQRTDIQVGILSMPNLNARTVAVCSPESRCFNTASAGWAGVVTPDTKTLELPAGTYKLKFGAHYLDGVEVTAGQRTDIRVGMLSLPNLTARTVAVCSPESRCFNTASAGWAGVVTPETQILELPAGTYKLKFDEQFVEGVSIAAGQTLVFD